MRLTVPAGLAAALADVATTQAAAITLQAETGRLHIDARNPDCATIHTVLRATVDDPGIVTVPTTPAARLPWSDGPITVRTRSGIVEFEHAEGTTLRTLTIPTVPHAWQPPRWDGLPGWDLPAGALADGCRFLASLGAMTVDVEASTRSVRLVGQSLARTVLSAVDVRASFEGDSHVRTLVVTTTLPALAAAGNADAALVLRAADRPDRALTVTSEGRAATVPYQGVTRHLGRHLDGLEILAPAVVGRTVFGEHLAAVCRALGPARVRVRIDSGSLSTSTVTRHGSMATATPSSVGRDSAQITVDCGRLAAAVGAHGEDLLTVAICRLPQPGGGRLPVLTVGPASRLAVLAAIAPDDRP